jgi:hypothetical protein
MRKLHMKKCKYDNFDESKSNFDSDPKEFNPFNGYRQRLTKQSKSPYLRLGGF